MNQTDRLVARSRIAVERHQLAKASGNPSEIATARQELSIVKRELERAKAEDEALSAVKQAMRAPKRIGQNVGR